MNFKNFKQLRRKSLWTDELSGYQYPLVIKSHLFGVLHNSSSYNSYIENLLRKSNYLSFILCGEDSVPPIRSESAIYLKKEAERIKQMIKEDKSKNMGVE